MSCGNYVSFYKFLKINFCRASSIDFLNQSYPSIKKTNYSACQYFFLTMEDTIVFPTIDRVLDSIRVKFKYIIHEYEHMFELPFKSLKSMFVDGSYSLQIHVNSALKH